MHDDFLITHIEAREILSNGALPMVEVDVKTHGGGFGRAGAPFGTYPLAHEAVVLKDGGQRYGGKGVLNAVRHVNEGIASKLKGIDANHQREIDMLMIEMDGTENKSQLGANAILSVSLAVAEAAANTRGIPLYTYIGGCNAHILPIPQILIALGGPFYSRTLTFQEYHIMPVQATSFSEALRISIEVFYEFGKLLRKKTGKPAMIAYGTVYTPPLEDDEAIFALIMQAINHLGYEDRFKLSLDCATSHIYNEAKETYLLKGKEVHRSEMIEYYEQLVEHYPLFSLEDPLFYEDFQGHAELMKRLGVQIVGDDLFITHIKRLQKGTKLGAANAMLLKPNQVGTLTESLDAVNFAYQHGYQVVSSGRQGNSEDQISDITVAVNCSQTKPGPIGPRAPKFNRLLEIERELGSAARYAGKSFPFL